MSLHSLFASLEDHLLKIEQRDHTPNALLMPFCTWYAIATSNLQISIALSAIIAEFPPRRRKQTRTATRETTVFIYTSTCGVYLNLYLRPWVLSLLIKLYKAHVNERKTITLFFFKMKPFQMLAFQAVIKFVYSVWKLMILPNFSASSEAPVWKLHVKVSGEKSNIYGFVPLNL